ncbi:RNA-binding protein 7 [Neopsephotus bourkii]|uniref:RNA-binding protein 7 n=1 Tax=Neopsephotus bourkii TaxID=309878 RepID=UPI002AA53C33|nr:RNA-binding protein 7 [Neopsephotus bourkii]XP_061224261.1 RNA-binding protein 7 [Neopsephotus bourkii]
MGAAAELDRTLFVGNLDPRVTEELIFELFHQAGPVIKVKIPKDRDGRPKQFAFVNFKHEESVPYGLNLLNGIKLYGRPIKIQFRSGSSHAAQESCSPQGTTSTSPLGVPHPASTGSRYDRSPDGMVPAGFPSAHRSLPTADNLQRQAMLNSALWPQPHFGGKYEQPGFSPPGYQPPAYSYHPATGCSLPRHPELLRKSRLGAHPYHPDGRHGSREQPRFGERGHDHEHRYRASREEPGYDDRHQDSWSHDYRREPRWHPVRH